ncbi:FAD synthetase [Fusarium coicis]|nr:FAD synthetase [Fusarium coicis]
MFSIYGSLVSRIKYTEVSDVDIGGDGDEEKDLQAKSIHNEDDDFHRNFPPPPASNPKGDYDLMRVCRAAYQEITRCWNFYRPQVPARMILDNSHDNALRVKKLSSIDIDASSDLVIVERWCHGSDRVSGIQGAGNYWPRGTSMMYDGLRGIQRVVIPVGKNLSFTDHSRYLACVKAAFPDIETTYFCVQPAQLVRYKWSHIEMPAFLVTQPWPGNEVFRARGRIFYENSPTRDRMEAARQSSSTLFTPFTPVASRAIMISTPPPRSLRDKCLELQQKVEAFIAEEAETQTLRDLQDQVRKSIEVVDEALQKYRPEQISLSYNGGKDCLVLLILLLARMGRHYYSTSDTTNGTSELTPPEKLQCVYIVAAHPFPEVDTFVEASSEEYGLEVARYVLPMKKGLEIYLEERPSIKAVFVGTRRTDPHGENLTFFDPTDAGWPSFMRIHPVIDWHYVQIWAFIRHLGIEYCPLYDQGYTSLGGIKDTHPNPHLKKQGQNGQGFRPAYELTQDDEERLGRDS